MRRTLIILSLVASCSGGDPATGADATSPAPVGGDECAAFATAMCARVDACAPAWVRYGTGRERAFGSVAACAKRFEQACEGWIAAPGSRLRLDDVKYCVTELGQSSCCEALAAYDSPAILECLDVPGKQELNSACATWSQCEGRRCDGAGTGCGKCGVNTTDTLADEGATCGGTTACKYWFDCKTGKCTCSPRTDTCLPGAAGCAIVLAAKDQSCGTNNLQGPESYCQTGQDCVNKNDLGTGHCQDYAPDGGACSPYEGPPCLYPARCIDQKCTPPGAGVCGG